MLGYMSNFASHETEGHYPEICILLI
ncbi:hypothetical protein U2A404210111 [Corynebacterium striatum]|nr:hypothetical protein U2A404210111 [Corynebacterium striatum]